LEGDEKKAKSKKIRGLFEIEDGGVRAGGGSGEEERLLGRLGQDSSF
jgi:hypothetical protein